MAEQGTRTYVQPTKKHTARHPGLRNKPEHLKDAITFVSTKKELMLYMDDGSIIKFAARRYQTHDAKEIEFLTDHPAFGDVFFKTTFPDYVLEKMKEDKKLIYHSEDYFQNPEA